MKAGGGLRKVCCILQTVRTLEEWVGPGLGGPWLRSLALEACDTRLLRGIQRYCGRVHVYLNSCPNAICPPGREVSPVHQYAMAGAVSFPFFWLAGAGSAVFWVLGEYRVWVAGVGGGGQVQEQGPEPSVFPQEPPSWSLAPMLPSTRLRPSMGKSCRWSQCEVSASLQSQRPIPVLHSSAPAKGPLPFISPGKQLWK